MKVIKVLADDYSVLGFDEAVSPDIIDNGWTVVNAPRPLDWSWWSDGGWELGVKVSEGLFLNGRFYAAGDLNGESPLYGTLGKSWSANGAVVVELLDLAAVIAMVKEEAGEYYEDAIAFYCGGGDNAADAAVAIAADLGLVVVPRG